MISLLLAVLSVLLSFHFYGAHESKVIKVPPEKAAELRTRFDEASEAERAADLAEQFCQARKWEREAKHNAWIATQYKIARELNVPLDFILDMETMTFKAKPSENPSEKSPSTPR